ncbi:NAD(P)H-dependent oxidoreductase [Sphingomonas sp. KRR8]|uniref:FMN-dependent NADH-azoreductase n=1 Tax=Sphingomonas sp. KRR8 TaxID=2942996 RepID=UPI00202288C6|nr:NAD(P)H-dependent oxidoreductase [Sphingomonas sp. KRR8]URD60828.1 NAD(P)H-dependent oxidoreductase [Sphingomonas sp. KRR8]
MSRILRVDSSITGEHSVSRQLTAHILKQLTAAEPGAEVVERDLTADPLPHLTLEHLGPNAELDAFMAADTVVIGAPMYNFTVPTQLKAWLDRIVANGTTFRYTAEGTPEGLAGGRRVIVALSRGGFYGAEQGNAEFEHLETYLRAIFAFVGITPEFVRADGLNLGAEAKSRGVEAALGEVERLAA